MILGCIADDFTGASDIANTLTNGGMQSALYSGVPKLTEPESVDAGIVSLKTRTVPANEAVEESLKAARWLLDQGCEQLYFKYCSTFDSTKEGNIGPVADALAGLLDESQVLFSPAFPAAGRTVYQGQLFVNDSPLHESSMKNHPLTPMTDSDLRRWLSSQTSTPIKHVPYGIVSNGVETISQFLRDEGPGYFIADAIHDDDLIHLSKSMACSKLLTGSSGLALGLPEIYRGLGKLNGGLGTWRGVKGRGVILSGSCSEATRAQIEEYKKGHPWLELSADKIHNEQTILQEVVDWILDQDQTPLVYTSADPCVVKLSQEKYGAESIANQIESFFGNLARLLALEGFSKIVTAGGETSGAVVHALEIDAMEVGSEIAPGVPSLKVVNRELALALKSGNFGHRHFFQDAVEALG